MRRRREDGVMAHGGFPPDSGGSIPASSLHFWFNDHESAKDLVGTFHYSARWPVSVVLSVTAHLDGGLFGNKGEAVAAAVFTIPGTRWSEPVIELSRLVRRDGVRVPLSALVAASVRQIRKRQIADLIVSFADRTQGHHGGVYQACGWKYHGQRESAMDGVIVDGIFVPGRSANNKWGTRSPDKLAERGIAAEGHWDAGKHLYWIAVTKNGRTIADRLGLLAIPYPKPQACEVVDGDAA